MEPLKSSVKYFENGMNSHNAVTKITPVGDNIYCIERSKKRSTLRVLIVDIYIVGEADIYEINPRILNVDAIVLVGFYNSYSSDAKNAAKDMGIGLFNPREFMGAVNFINEHFLNYVRKEPNRKDAIE